ncbi:MAG: 5'-nucleotidase C-terminal domain-containing protein, partial [Gaiellaceae bacterium]
AVVRQYTDAAAPLANRVIGHIQGDLTRATSPFGEETLGDVIADGQLAATAPPTLGGAVIAFMNPGGIRADLFFATRSGAVTYGDAFTVQPFGNSLVTKTMTGDMIHRVLEQQFLGCQAPGAVPAPATGRILQISSSFKYEQKFDAPTCAAKVGRMWINGVEVVPATPYRVTMNNFLATGGDGFGVFNEGTEVLGGAQDIDAWVDYFQSKEPAGIAVPALNRIVAKP